MKVSYPYLSVASTGKFGYLGLDAAAIQIVTVLITGVLACLLALTTKANAQQKIDVVKRITAKDTGSS